MLPPDLTRARKREGKLKLAPLSDAEKPRALGLAEALVAATHAAVGLEREQVEAAWAAVPADARERKLLLGLTHLVEARSLFSSPASSDAERVRRAVFGRAAQRRGELPDGSYLEREAVLAEVAPELGLTTDELEQALYADLRSAQRLESCTLGNAAGLLAEYELLQVQSVLLRAVRVVAEVRASAPDLYRELFRKLKFRQLLYRIEPLRGGGYRLEIDGPLSLFEATTKYGLELAQSLPALLACGSVQLKAELRWGKRREPLSFELALGQNRTDSASSAVRDEVSELLEAITAAGSWSARLSDTLLDLTEEGGGVLVPDLELSREARGPRGKASTTRSVLVEVLGFWSRDAVFRRIEAAERGLATPVLFVVSSRLRVSEELLDGSESARLYVYKGKINPQALLRKAEALLR
jgi:predicted nuclease of restriction endonuclease-like RecB superfamily